MSLNLIKDKIPLSGTGSEAIVATITKVLKIDNIVKLAIDARTGMVDFWRVPSEEEKQEEINPFRGVLKQVTMEEYSPEEEESGERQFLSMCEIIEDAGSYPVFILTGREFSKLRKWVNFPRRSKQIAGIPILLNPDVVEDVILICGAKSKDADPIDTDFIVKMTLP